MKPLRVGARGWAGHCIGLIDGKTLGESACKQPPPPPLVCSCISFDWKLRKGSM